MPGASGASIKLPGGVPVAGGDSGDSGHRGYISWIVS
jgi:hypothetical protein